MKKCGVLLVLGILLSSNVMAKPMVLTTTGMIADAAKKIGQDRVDVKSLMGSGVDPHLYKPTRSDMALLSQADLVLYNGLLLEGKMQDVLIRLGTAGKKIVAVTREIKEKNLLSPAAFQGHEDPHVWMDPRTWVAIGSVVAAELTVLDPAGATEFSKNAAAWKAEVMALDGYCEKIMKTIPKETRVLVTAHDAFNYFGRRYGIEVMGIQGISTDSEAGVNDIQKLVTTLVKRRVPAVFVETTVADRNIRALIEGAKAQSHPVKLGGRLFSDAMGAADTYEGTYIGMIDHNATRIVQALGGVAPEKGFRNQLSKMAE